MYYARMLSPTLAEMTAWSAEQILCALENALPTGWSLTRILDDSEVATFQITDTDGQVVWANTSFDERLLLLDAFGWLFVRNVSQKQDGPWATRHQELTRHITQIGSAFEDPADLDPMELAAVYSRAPGKPGHDGG